MKEKSRSGDDAGHKGWYSRGYLPHRDEPSLLQHVSFHLADSLPPEALDRLTSALAECPDDKRSRLRRQRIEELADAGYGSCILRRPEVAAMVENSLLHFHGDRCDVHAWVVMPNHLHVLFEPLGKWKLPSIVASWKKFTARRIRDFIRCAPPDAAITDAERQLLASGRPVWDAEFFDRFIRNERHYRDVVAYIDNNPVKAGLVARPEDWRWSSAARKPNPE